MQVQQLLRELLENLRGAGEFKRSEAIALLSILVEMAERLEKLEHLNEVRPN